MLASTFPPCLRAMFIVVAVMMGRFVGATTPSEMRYMMEQGGGIADSMMDQVAAAASLNVSGVMDSTTGTVDKTMELGSTVVDDLTLGVNRLLKGENPWLDYPPPIPMESSMPDMPTEQSTEPTPSAGDNMDSSMPAMPTEQAPEAASSPEQPTEPAISADGSKSVYVCANYKVSMGDLFSAPDTQYAKIPESVVKWDGSNWVLASMPAAMMEERAGRR